MTHDDLVKKLVAGIREAIIAHRDSHTWVSDGFEADSMKIDGDIPLTPIAEAAIAIVAGAPETLAAEAICGKGPVLSLRDLESGKLRPAMDPMGAPSRRSFLQAVAPLIAVASNPDAVAAGAEAGHIDGQEFFIREPMFLDFSMLGDAKITNCSFKWVGAHPISCPLLFSESAVQALDDVGLTVRTSSP
jgi:hypothetical protein